MARKAGVPIIPCLFDYEHKTVHFLKPFYPTSDTEKDMDTLWSFYKGVKGAKPEYSITGDRIRSEKWRVKSEEWKVKSEKAEGAKEAKKHALPFLKKDRWLQIIDPSAVGTVDIVKWGFNPTKKG